MKMLPEIILKIVAVFLICGALSQFSGNTGKKILRLSGGVIVTVLLLQAFLRMEPDVFLNQMLPDLHAAQEAVDAGVKMAEDSKSDIIKEACEAYILDKAEVLGLSLSVEVVLEEKDLQAPAEVYLMGTWNQVQRQQLSVLIAQELGIPEVAQHWTGGYKRNP